MFSFFLVDSRWTPRPAPEAVAGASPPQVCMRLGVSSLVIATPRAYRDDVEDACVANGPRIPEERHPLGLLKANAIVCTFRPKYVCACGMLCPWASGPILPARRFRRARNVMAPRSLSSGVAALST